MKRTFIVLFLLVAGLTAMAQDNYITLRGRITDRETHEALPAVAVYVAGQATYTQTNVVPTTSSMTRLSGSSTTSSPLKSPRGRNL